MKKFFRNALAFGLAGVACLSLTACGGDDAAKIEAQNREAFNTFYTTVSNYGNNLQALTSNDATNQKQFEFKVKFGANAQYAIVDDMGAYAGLETMLDMNYELGLGAKTGAESDIYAYIKTKNLDGEMTQWMRAYLQTKANDDIYVPYYGEGAPKDWTTNYSNYYLLDVENSHYVKNTSSKYSYYKTYYTYDPSTEIYDLVSGEPADWATNYANYYVMDFAYIANTNPVYDAETTYYQLSDMVYSYVDADTDQYFKFELLTAQPADWATSYYNYYVLDGDDYLCNTEPTFETGKFYKMTSSLPEMIAADIYTDDINGKLTFDIPTQIIANAFASLGGDDSTGADVDMGQIQEAINSIKSIKDYDGFKAQIGELGATISSTKDGNGSTLIINQTTSYEGMMSVVELKLAVSNDGTIKVLLTAKQTSMGMTILSASVNLEVSMTNVFDETKIPSEAELKDYKLVNFSDLF